MFFNFFVYRFLIFVPVDFLDFCYFGFSLSLQRSPGDSCVHFLGQVLFAVFVVHLLALDSLHMGLVFPLFCLFCRWVADRFAALCSGFVRFDQFFYLEAHFVRVLVTGVLVASMVNRTCIFLSCMFCDEPWALIRAIISDDYP